MPCGRFRDRQLRSNRRFHQPREQRDGRSVAEPVSKQRAHQSRVELGLLANYLLQRGLVRVARLQNHENALRRGDWRVRGGLRGGFSDGLQRAKQNDGDGAVRVGRERGGGEESAETVGLEDGGVERLLAERGNVELGEDGMEGRQLREAMKETELGGRNVGEGERMEKILEERGGMKSGEGGRASEADLHEGCELGEEGGVERGLGEGSEGGEERRMERRLQLENQAKQIAIERVVEVGEASVHQAGRQQSDDLCAVGIDERMQRVEQQLRRQRHARQRVQQR